MKCLAVHPNRVVVASGQGPAQYRREGRPHIRVWDSVSLATLHTLGLGQFRRAPAVLAFSR